MKLFEVEGARAQVPIAGDAPVRTLYLKWPHRMTLH